MGAVVLPRRQDLPDQLRYTEAYPYDTVSLRRGNSKRTPSRLGGNVRFDAIVARCRTASLLANLDSLGQGSVSSTDQRSRRHGTWTGRCRRSSRSFDWVSRAGCAVVVTVIAPQTLVLVAPLARPLADTERSTTVRGRLLEVVEVPMTELPEGRLSSVRDRRRGARRTREDTLHDFGEARLDPRQPVKLARGLREWSSLVLRSRRAWYAAAAMGFPFSARMVGPTASPLAIQLEGAGEGTGDRSHGDLVNQILRWVDGVAVQSGRGAKAGDR